MPNAAETLLNIEYVFKLRSLMDESLSDLPYEIKNNISSFLDATLISKNIDLSDIKKRGAYNGLLFGCDNTQLFNDFIGLHPKSLINDDASYLIEIERTFRESTLSFEFYDQTSELSRKRIDILVRLFKKYNTETDIEKFVRSVKIPALLIKDFDLSYLSNPDDDIKVLIGENLIKKVKISIPIQPNDTRCPSIRSINIITPNFAGLHQFDLIQLKSLFGRNLSEYNFIYLNSENDFLLEQFFKTIVGFERYFGIENVLNGLYQHIFFLKDAKYLLSTRFFNEKAEYLRFADVSFENVFDYRNSRTSLNFVLGHLLLMSSVIRGEIDKQSKESQQFTNYSKILVTDFSHTISSDETQLLPLYLEIKRKLLALQVNYTDKIIEPYKSDRDSFFDKYDSLLKSLQYFSNKFLRHISNQIEENINSSSAEKTNFTNSKSFLLIMEEYRESNVDFKMFVLDKINKLDIFVEKIPLSIKFESIRLFFSEFDRLSIKTPNISENLKTDSALTRLENTVSRQLIQLMSENTARHLYSENQR